MAIITGLFLSGCSNPFDLLGAIEKDVKRANGKFLTISGVGPVKNAVNVNPSDPIWIEFDRQIDDTTLTPDNIVLSPSVSWIYTYDPDLKKVSINAPLEGNVSYTVTVTKNVKGTDGNNLEQAYLWAFTTLDLPSGTISINGGATYKSTVGGSVTLNITGNTKAAEMRYSWNKAWFANYNENWVDFSSTITYPLSDSGIGTHTVYIQFRDAANLLRTGNPFENDPKAISDSIIVGTITIDSPINTASGNNIQLAWTPATRQDTGTNTYRIYRRLDIKRDFLLAETATPSYSFTAEKGVVYPLFVRMYNSAMKCTGPMSNIKYAFNSDIVVIYNDANAGDTSTANSIKSVLTTNLPVQYGSSVSGIMPAWTVTLFPQSYVSTTYESWNVVSGKPVIITPGFSSYDVSGRVRNVTAHGHGVIGMGEGGTRLIDTVTANWGAWGYTGTTPSEIGWGQSMIGTTTLFMYTWTSGNSVWSSPLQSSTFPHTFSLVTHNASTQISYTSFNRASVFRMAATNPTDGNLFGREDDLVGQHFPVVRQGRFLHFGFYGLPDRWYTGWVYWTNLVAKMDDY